MDELAQTLIGNGVGAPPAHILEFIDDETAHRGFPGAPHSIYEEIWHLAFWQQLSLDWIGGKSTPYLNMPPMASLPRLMRCGLCCTNDFFAERSKPPASPGTMRSSESQFFAPHAILRHRVPCWFAGNSNSSRLTMPIIWVASFCCVSFSERGRRLRVETPGEKSMCDRDDCKRK